MIYTSSSQEVNRASWVAQKRLTFVLLIKKGYIVTLWLCIVLLLGRAGTYFVLVCEGGTDKNMLGTPDLDYSL